MVPCITSSTPRPELSMLANASMNTPQSTAFSCFIFTGGQGVGITQLSTSVTARRELGIRVRLYSLSFRRQELALIVLQPQCFSGDSPSLSCIRFRLLAFARLFIIRTDTQAHKRSICHIRRISPLRLCHHPGLTVAFTSTYIPILQSQRDGSISLHTVSQFLA